MTSEAMHEAIDAAKAFLAPRWRERWQTVCAVVITESGERHMATNLACRLPRAGVCAEPVAIGMALSNNPNDGIAFCATVNRQGDIVPPCGVCRELLLDYAREAIIAVPDEPGIRFTAVDELVPNAYESTDRRRLGPPPDRPDQEITP